MLEQREDDSHEITLHKICCHGCDVYANTSGVLSWNRETGSTFELVFDGIHALKGTTYYDHPPSKTPGVGRFVDEDLGQPNWIAETDDGTPVSLYGVIQTPTSSRTSGTSGGITTCSFKGTAKFAVVDIPANRTLAFENAAEDDYRMFFIGSAGARFQETKKVSFQREDGAEFTCQRCSTTLSDTPHVVLASSTPLIKCQPSGWLAFGDSLAASDCEFPAFPERMFVSFLNGENVPFHWADRRTAPDTIRRTYFGWVKSRQSDSDEPLHAPLPFMGGVEVFRYGEEVRSHIPKLFQLFVERSQIFDFGTALHPLWTALNGVLDDRLALASISLERVASYWKNCKSEVLSGPAASDSSIWRNKQLRHSIKESLLSKVEEILVSEACDQLEKDEKDELKRVLEARINNIPNPPNTANLQRPFEDLQIPLSNEEKQAMKKRNDALHGRQDNGDASGLLDLEKPAEYFDRIRMLVTKFVLKLCEYEGPYIDYASRPTDGNFTVKKL